MSHLSRRSLVRHARVRGAPLGSPLYQLPDYPVRSVKAGGTQEGVQSARLETRPSSETDMQLNLVSGKDFNKVFET